MRALSVVGRSGSGKTTLLERLIPVLGSKGLRVAAVKHSHHERLDVDRSGTDSFRLLASGADAVALVTGDRIVLTATCRREPTFQDVVDRLPAVDLVLVESWKGAALPALEVVGDPADRIDPATCGARVAIAADVPLADPLPRFRRDDVEGIAAFVLAWTRG